MTSINNLRLYNLRMQQMLLDKAFFLRIIDANTYVDYGCGNGALLKFIDNLFPNCRLIGYDNNPKELDEARINFPKGEYYDDWQDVSKLIISKLIRIGDSSEPKDKTALILSSVIHEIISYGDEWSSYKLWEKVFLSGFDYIVIRDMALSDSAYRRSNSDDLYKMRKSRVIMEKQFKDFKHEGYNLENNNDFVHLLLKYRYLDNWEREVKENYLPLTYEEYIKIIKDYGRYNIIHNNHYKVPWIVKKIKEDFDINLADNTHVKLILELRR